MKSTKRLVNLHEEAALKELQDLGAEFGYSIYPKVRVADVLSVWAGQVRPDLLTFALKAHFDFTAFDSNHNPVFAVEFDGRFHNLAEQRARDVKKDELCSVFEFPLLRINSNHVLRRYNKRSLLRWIISAWELQKAFDEGQRKGAIPLDEPFDPTGFYHSGTTVEEVHPHWISLRERLHIHRLHEQEKLPHITSSGLIFTYKEHSYRGIEWIDIADGRVVSVESAMKKQNFPLYLGDLFAEILFVLAYDCSCSLMISFSDSSGQVRERLLPRLWSGELTTSLADTGSATSMVEVRGLACGRSWTAGPFS
jgi:hypothetical protein